MKFKQLRNLICAGLISGAILWSGTSEAGVVTDRLPLQCYADHQVNTYNSPGAAKRAGYISANVDLIKITQVRGDGWCYGSYPGAGGKRVSRWFRITDVCADAGYSNRSVNVRGNQTVYRTPSGGATLGSVSNNESVIVVADNGSRAQIVYRLDNGTGYKLGWVPSAAVTAAPNPVHQGYNPQGNFEGVSSPAANQIRVEGWAADRDNMGESLRVHVYVGGGAGSGAESYEIVANKSRPDVRDWFGRQGIPAGEFYGFNNVINVKRTGRQEVYVYAINVGGGNTVELGHKTVDIKGNSVLTNISPSGYAYPLGKKTYFGNGHDCAMPEGTPIYAVESGTANFYQVMGNYAGRGYATVSYGNYVELKCDNGAVAKYGHLSRFEGIALKYKSMKNYGSTYKACTNYGKKFVGSRRVNKGDLIGYVGTTGNSSGNHLHLELYIHGNRQNLNAYFNK